MTHEGDLKDVRRSVKKMGRGGVFFVFLSAPFQLWSLSFFRFETIIPGTGARFSEPLPDRRHVCALLICEPDYEAMLKSILENLLHPKIKKTSNEMCI